MPPKLIFTYNYLEYGKFKEFFKESKLYLDFLYNKGFITEVQKDVSFNCLNEYIKHYQHIRLNMPVYDNVLKKETNYEVTITHWDADIKIKNKSLIDIYCNNIYKPSPTIKIADGLYISSNYWIVENKNTPFYNMIKPVELRFDEKKGCYVYESGTYKKDHTNLTLENTQKMETIFQEKLNNKEMKLIDLTNHLHIEESLFMYTLLQTKAYEEPEEKWNKLEQEWSHKLKYDKNLINEYYKNKSQLDNKKKPDEE